MKKTLIAILLLLGITAFAQTNTTATNGPDVQQAIGTLVHAIAPNVSLEQITSLIAALFVVARLLRKAIPDSAQNGTLGTWLKHVALEINPPPATPPAAPAAAKSNVTTLLLCLGIAAVMLAGCKTRTADTAYNSEKLLTDAATAATHTFNIYYHQQLSGNQPPANIDQLNSARDTLYDADRKMSATLAVVDQLRINYTANPAVTNQSAMFIALQSAADQSSNIVALVKVFMGTNTPVK